MSAVIPDEDVFYVVGLLHASGFNGWQAFDEVNRQILQFCNEAGILVKQYLPPMKHRRIGKTISEQSGKVSKTGKLGLIQTRY